MRGGAENQTNNSSPSCVAPTRRAAVIDTGGALKLLFGTFISGSVQQRSEHTSSAALDV